MSNKLSPAVRIITLVAALAMFCVLLFPIWKIDLTAPQYPEGLVLKIHANKLSGDVEVINGLNHYIGMKHLIQDEFIEFKVLPYIIGGFGALGLLVFFINRRKAFYAYLILFLFIAFASMYDFWRWEYDYGHNLDDSAPIKVPGMAYQPPLIGYKKLLNFGAYSIPDIGGWIFIGVGLLLVIGAYLEWKKVKKMKLSTGAAALLVIASMFTLTSCQSGPQAIRFGTDACDHCKMTIMDNRYGAEILTEKGKVYKYDDITCLMMAMKGETFQEQHIGNIYLVDFSGKGQLVPVDQALLLQSEQVNGPMGGKLIAFSNPDSLKKYAAELNGSEIDWKTYQSK
jgi:copper chaperone NosL